MRRFLLAAATFALLLSGVRQAHAGFCITLSVASWGKGSLSRGDFYGFVWDSKGATLDGTKELAGPPTSGALWGATPGAFGCSEFDFVNNGTAGAAPSATNYLPPAALTLLGFGAVGLLGYGWRKRQRAAPERRGAS
jgi:hypothetical protein